MMTVTLIEATRNATLRDMTEEALIPFWTVSAQVIPVLALALVLEARVIGRQLSKKKRFADKRLRRFWGHALKALSYMLSTSMLLALWNLAFPSGAGEEVSVLTNIVLWFISISIWLGVTFTFSYPLTMIHSPLLQDEPSLTARWNPLSRLNRLRRRARKLRFDIENAIRETRDRRHGSLLLTADAAIHIARSQSHIEAARSFLHDPALTPTKRIEVRGWIAEMEEVAEQADSTYAECLEYTRELNDILTERAENLATVLSIERSPTAELEKEQLSGLRKVLAEASRP